MMGGTKAPSTQPYIGGPVLVGNYNGSNGNKNGALQRSADIGLILLLCFGVHFFSLTI
jgi:hypothetical protein